MRGVNTWSFRPYRPALESIDGTKASPLHIVRLAPSGTSLELEWLDTSDSPKGEYTVCVKNAETGEEMRRTFTATRAAIDSLLMNCEYTVKVECDGICSAERLFRTGYHPGLCVNYLHPNDKIYAFSGLSLCSPSIVKHERDGYMLASMDVYAPGAPQNLTIVFRSDDSGKSWYYLCDIFPCFWGKLFCHRNEIYMLGTSNEYGDILIGRYDGDKSFCMPSVLFRGSCSRQAAGNHHAPMPVVETAGRLWTAFEYGSWQVGGHCATMLSCGADGDLLDAGNWTLAEATPYDPSWPGTVSGPSRGNIEGNAVIGPDGKLYNVMRYQTDNCEPSWGKALVYSVDTENPEAPLVFDRVIDFPGNLSKFEINYDEITKRYWCILSRIYDPAKTGTRNVLSLAVSDNLFDWEVVCDLLDWRYDDPKMVGFQYVSFIFDGDDILYLCRTAVNNANNFHDANYSTLHRVKIQGREGGGDAATF